MPHQVCYGVGICESTDCRSHFLITNKGPKRKFCSKPCRNRESSRRRMLREPEKVRTANQASYYRHHEKNIERSRGYSSANLASENKRHRDYDRRTGSGRWRQRRYELRKKTSTPKDQQVTQSEWLMLLVAFEFRCAYCGKLDGMLTQDHIVPISKGGTDTLSNIIPACETCNKRKGNKSLEQFVADNL